MLASDAGTNICSRRIQTERRERCRSVWLLQADFTPSHRGGSGPPLVCIHGFMDTWRTWDLVLPAVEHRHEVLAPTLPGHAGGAPLPSEPAASGLAAGVAPA